MARRTARFTVGRQRLGRMISPSEAGYTRDIRKQMERIEKNLAAVIAQIENVTPEALEYAVQPIFDKSQVYVPKDTHALAESGHVEAVRTSAGTKVVVSYGKGGKPFYAVYVHEILEYAHQSPTRAKYLEAAVNEHLDEVLPRAKDFIARNIGMA